MVPRPMSHPVPSPEKTLRSDVATLAPRHSVSSLPSSIDSELLKAVPLELVVAGCGKQWQHDTDDFGLSECVEKIDAFLSHDWGTRRWLKTTTMLVHFNCIPATVASILMCIIVCLLQICKVLHSWPPAVLAIHTTYWFVFVFWQTSRGFFCRKNMVFLDRLCIPQHDADLKRQGILGLGGFLDHSRKLLVLWSPRYFTRLWTAFELAAFMKHDQARAKDIEFAPASIGPLLLYFCMFETMLATSFHLALSQFVLALLGEQDVERKQEDNAVQFAVIILAICAPAFFVVAPILLYLGTMQMKALLQLKIQVDQFQIRSAKCSCCEMDHCHPETGEELICDRMLVFETLKRWFPDEVSSEAHLDRFDEIFQKQLSGFVRSILGSGAPPLRYIVGITVHPLLGLLCQYVHFAVNDYFNWTFVGWMIGWFQTPPMVYLALWEFLVCWRMGARYSHRFPLCLILFLGMTAGIGFNILLWLQYTIFKVVFGYDFQWPVVGSLVNSVSMIPYIFEYSPLCRKQG